MTSATYGFYFVFRYKDESKKAISFIIPQISSINNAIAADVNDPGFSIPGTENTVPETTVPDTDTTDPATGTDEATSDSSSTSDTSSSTGKNLDETVADKPQKTRSIDSGKTKGSTSTRISKAPTIKVKPKAPAIDAKFAPPSRIIKDDAGISTEELATVTLPEFKETDDMTDEELDNETFLDDDDDEDEDETTTDTGSEDLSDDGSSTKEADTLATTKSSTSTATPAATDSATATTAATLSEPSTATGTDLAKTADSTEPVAKPAPPTEEEIKAKEQ